MKDQTEIQAAFDRAEKIVQDPNASEVETQHAEAVQNALGWVLGFYNDAPCQDD